MKNLLFLTGCLVLMAILISTPAQAVISTEAVVTAPEPVKSTEQGVPDGAPPVIVETSVTVLEGCSCLLPSEAGARFRNYVTCAETICGYGDPDANSQLAPKYFFTAAPGGMHKSVPEHEGTVAPVLQSTQANSDIGEASPTAIPTMASGEQTTAGNGERAAVPVITSPTVKSVSITGTSLEQVHQAKPHENIFERVIGFFGSLFSPQLPA